MFKLESSELVDIVKINENEYRIDVKSTVTDIIPLLKDIYEYENEQIEIIDEEEKKKIGQQYKYKNPVVMVSLKNCQKEVIAEAIKFSLTYEELRDPLMILNIINLVKIYNNLSLKYFESPEIYFSEISDILDVKQSIRKELKEFSKQLSIYFISLIKSYNKVEYTPTDRYITLPTLYSTIFASLDWVTITGIFSNSESFDTSECTYIMNAVNFVSVMMTKNITGLYLMNSFLQDMELKEKELKIDGNIS